MFLSRITITWKWWIFLSVVAAPVPLLQVQLFIKSSVFWLIFAAGCWFASSISLYYVVKARENNHTNQTPHYSSFCHLFFLTYLIGMHSWYWSSLFLSKVLSSRLTWLHPGPKGCIVADWNSLIGAWMIQAKGMCCCSVAPLLFHPRVSSCLQTFTARATIVGQQRMFSHLQGWRTKLVNTSLQRRGAPGTGINCDDFKVGPVLCELAAVCITPRMIFLNLILCCTSVVTDFPVWSAACAINGTRPFSPL